MNEIGRLNGDDIKKLNKFISEVCKLIDKKQTKKAEKKLIKRSKTPNYFVREYLGNNLVKCDNREEMEKIANNMLDHKMYGVRATALFYLYLIYDEQPKKIFEILEKTYDTVPWEAETIINDMWKKFPHLMKEKMLLWVESDSEKKRALSFHGMENIASQDTNYILDFISKTIDDESIEVQKKITHILTQVVRVNPIVVFPYVREWLLKADDKSIKTIWVSMKKLANIVVQRNRRNRSQELVRLTQQTIDDWKHDENEKVAEMGGKLSRIVHRK